MAQTPRASSAVGHPDPKAAGADSTMNVTYNIEVALSIYICPSGPRNAALHKTGIIAITSLFSFKYSLPWGSC